MEQGIQKREPETGIPALYFIRDSSLVLNLNHFWIFQHNHIGPEHLQNGKISKSDEWMDGWMESHIPDFCVIIYNICVCNIAAYIF